MKSILISIRPEWVAKILNGEKTIEIRKTAPKCDLPIDVYIYCTNGRAVAKPNIFHPQFSVIKPSQRLGPKRGCVCAKFTLKAIEWHTSPVSKFGKAYIDYLERESCVPFNEIEKYSKGKGIWCWRISDLVIFDKVKELDQFEYLNLSGIRNVSQRSLKGCKSKKHPPQSWCYVEVKQ